MIDEILTKVHEINYLIKRQHGDVEGVIKLGISYEAYNYIIHALHEERKYKHYLTPVGLNNVCIQGIELSPVKRTEF